MSNEVYSYRSKAALLFRRKLLLKQFQGQYVDLLQAIKNGNYEAIESLCEPKLTLELGSAIYELNRFKNV